MKLKTRDIILTALFASLTAVGAFIKIPIPYIPFTLQYFFCAFSGILLGSKLGALSQTLYVIIGLIGIPIFTQGGGPSYVLQPTFGYLIGFIVCAYVIGRFIEKMEQLNFAKILLSILCGMFFLYLFGLVYLYIILNFYLNKPTGISWVLFHGLFIFLGGDLLLSFIISILSVRIIPILNRTGLIYNTKIKR